MAKEIYTEIFEFYHVNHLNDSTKRAMRKVIREKLKGRQWENLTNIEKAEFKLITMQNYLLTRHTPPINKAEVEKNIDNELKATLFQAKKAQISHNEKVEILYKQFYDANATEEENFISYKEFCARIPEYAPKANIPSFDEWQKRPLTLYDYQQSEIYNSYQTDNLQELYDGAVPPERIDHYILECLRKIIEDKFKIEINVDSIRHCLETTKDIDLIENEICQAEIDETSPLPKEIQKQTIQNNLNIMESYRKLQSLDFITKKKRN